MDFNMLDKYLLEAEGKSQQELSEHNPYRDIGFDGGKKRLGWLRVIPFSEIKESLEKISSFIKDKKNFIFVGMGGSINGIKPLLALFKGHSIFTLDSLDPAALEEILRNIRDIEETLIIPISKSGTTKETHLLAGILKELFIEDWQNHFLWLIDIESSSTLDVSGWKKAVRFPIQFDKESDMGGRFSCPQSLIFLLPLFLLLKDFQKLEAIYNDYLQFQNDARRKAYDFTQQYKAGEGAYFYPVIKEEFREKFSSWITQLFQESLGSRDEKLPVKTIVDFVPGDEIFLPLEFAVASGGPVSYLMCQMYFFQAFIAYYAAERGINFVNQDYVERYKAQMRKLEGHRITDIPVKSLEAIIEEIKEKALGRQRFIEVVLYFHPRRQTVETIREKFSISFSDKRVLIFIGSDWNHSSFQAAYGDKNTFFVLLLKASYDSQLHSFSSSLLRKNADALITIGKATHLALKDKSLLVHLE